MNLEDTFECQMAAYSMCFFKNPLPWIALLVPFLAFSAFVGFGFLLPLLFTLFFVILSSTFLTFSKHKPVLLETSVEPILEPESETMTQPKNSQEGEVVRPLESFSESESIDQSSTTDQDSEEEEEEDSPDCSEDSISDEESLIEIAIPSGHYVGSPSPNKNEETQKFNLQQKFPDFSLMEILADINNEMYEEDNLIEIDISMGSIKCSRFEIEA